MLIRLREGSSASFAEQVASQIRQGVARGEIRVGEKLPSARELAASLNVNMHTVLRAYDSLREAGVIELGRGRGATVVSGDAPGIRSVLDSAAAIVADAAAAGITARELSWLIKGMA
ncbi:MULTISPECIES: GntR family transcriptional regulator [Subtercola]|uniref:GntR family transcriptional regulator n=1 Tax=Subtercola vilae TaxID=2056433 RepID=A0A4T2C9Q2_9MICO|nr:MULTISPECIES: GntR family transcriptional regulator [Subtercola]MEA9984288.1 GntR family transcriptional regulator [Subtercola sp. RTI3]TIH40141.1 GntR family transcriptional regulator [Subtercola vilae]